MTEILTESFCERCGTRYTFETAQRRSTSLGRLGTIGRGLKHFVVMSDASFDEAMAVARSEDEAKVTTAQLEAFHRTFNFCLQCRQYTCAECWNAVEGRCLTCAPLPVEERAAVQAVAAPPAPPRVAAPVAPRAVAPPSIVVEPAATIEILPTPEPAEAAPQPEPEQEPLAAEGPAAEAIEVEAVAEPAAEPELVAEPEPEPELAPEPEPLAAEAEAEPAPPLLVEPEAELVVAESELEPELEPEPEPAATLEPEPLAAAPQPEPATAPPPPAEAPSTAPAPTGAAPFPGFQPGRSLDDEIAAYELRIAALAAPTAPEPPIQAAAVHRAPPAAAAAASLPTPMAVPLPMMPTPATEEQPGLAPTPGTCRSCGLSISVSARFCRRCGARQAA